MRTLRRFLPVLIVLLLFLAAGLFVYTQAGPPLAHFPVDPLGDVTNIGLPIGIPAPEIEGKDIDGNWFKLSDYRGKVVALDLQIDR
jgi:hypothetical protein